VDPAKPVTLGLCAGHVAAGDGPVRGWCAEVAAHGQHEIICWLKDPDSRTRERHVGDRFRPLRVGAIRGARDRRYWWIRSDAERNVAVLYLVLRYRLRPGDVDRRWVLSRRLGLARGVSAGSGRVRGGVDGYHDVAVTKTGQRGRCVEDQNLVVKTWLGICATFKMYAARLAERDRAKQ
jgi:hypothetical protein